ncbi:MAG: alpha amylase C-terminal domain-containing protein [Polyangiaceae bacterium]|nr:alpha amylase C-terminal domain-containing protein [Polyangiaceae bacterium]
MPWTTSCSSASASGPRTPWTSSSWSPTSTTTTRSRAGSPWISTPWASIRTASFRFTICSVTCATSGGSRATMSASILPNCPCTCFAFGATCAASTAWPMVSRPNYLGGLGFGFKWDMGWMHDALGYFCHDPIHRKYHHHALTFRGLYALNEDFVLPLSHDEVAQGKGSLLGKMAGDEWRKLANLRLLYASMYALTVEKLLFMGAEFGQRAEWNHDASLEWHLLEEPPHQGVMKAITQLNRVYREQPALSELDTDPAGFEWIDANDSEASMLTFLRRGRGDSCVLVVLDFTPIVREAYQVGVDRLGTWREILNTDAREFGGSGVGNFGAVDAVPVPWHGRPVSLRLTVPPLAALFLEALPRPQTRSEEGQGPTDEAAGETGADMGVRVDEPGAIPLTGGRGMEPA